ncbi:hypothetical protein QFC22_004190 [Naganishia vaughanmartiniae]|uniref:Uncharacterized protein n=1 Tax=Naganishia vaughanmartiniae TaxID=1424756 RepID=A0ACC2X4E4_9TREE|nr:hypothetical protein QFC22_004190 [Naganishia vaughanmartiniae]
MAKKKKTALKPVARGFATISQPKKVVPEAVSEEPTTAVDVSAQDQNDILDGDTKPQEVQAGEGVDWEDDSKLEQGIYQGYVERLQEKGDREVAKVMKAIEFDRRTNRGYINLDVEPSLRDEILETDRARRRVKRELPFWYSGEEEGLTLNPKNVRAAVSIANSTDPIVKEKHLLRMYISYRVLTKLGYQESLVLECLKSMGEKDTWEDGLNWIYLHEHEASMTDHDKHV